MQGPPVPADPTRNGLARFRSAPSTWLDALLEDNNDNDDQFKPTLTHLLTDPGPGPDPAPNPAPNPAQPDPSWVGFQRMNSSPAEFLSANVDGYFSSFGGVSSNSFDFGGGGGGGEEVVTVRKRFREGGNEEHSQSLSFNGQRVRGELVKANSLVEMEMDKLLEDSVACRVRAKRGCATHPRSIAERVRRTRISDRIRKLQELVPNMDKQTNTSDMLEEAVEYVKTLQRQIQELTEQQKKCKCMPNS